MATLRKQRRSQAAVGPARPPERDQPQPEQRQPGAGREEAGEVVARRADLGRVVQGLDPGDDPEEADHQRDRRAGAAAHARVHERRQRERGQRNQPADQMIGGRRARLRLQEGVIGHMQADHADRRHEERGPVARGLGGRRGGACSNLPRGRSRCLSLGHRAGSLSRHAGDHIREVPSLPRRTAARRRTSRLGPAGPRIGKRDGGAALSASACPSAGFRWARANGGLSGVGRVACGASLWPPGFCVRRRVSGRWAR